MIQNENKNFEIEKSAKNKMRNKLFLYQLLKEALKFQLVAQLVAKSAVDLMTLISATSVKVVTAQ